MGRLLKCPYVGLAVISIIWLPINLYSLMSYPAPSSDEGWFGAGAAAFLATGRFEVPIFGNASLFFRGDLWRLYAVGLALAFRLGGVALLPGRLFSVAGALIGAWALFAFGCRLYGAGVGLLSAALYLFSTRVLASSHIVRPDIWVNVAGILCLLGFWQVKLSRQPRQAFLLGLVAALAVEVYVVGVYASIATTLAVLFEFRRRADWKMLGAYALGSAIWASVWLIGRYADGAGSTLAQWQTLYQTMSPRSNLLSPLALFSRMWAYVQAGLIGYSRLGVVESVYLVIGLFSLLTRRQTADKFVLFAALVLWLGLFYPPKSENHLIDLMPLFSLMIAAGAGRAAEFVAAQLPRLKPSLMFLSALLAGPLIAGYLFGNMWLGWQSRVIRDAQRAYNDQLRGLVPPDSRVLGDAVWWWALSDQVFTNHHYLNWYQSSYPQMSKEEVLAAVIKERRINVVLLDDLSGYPQSLYGSVVMMKTTVENYTRTHCRLAGFAAGQVIGVEVGGPALRRTDVFICPAP